MSGDEIEQDVNETESSAPETSSPSQENNAPPAEPQAGAESQQSKSIPYERFQELVKARQESDARSQQYEAQLAKMQRDFQEQLTRLQQPQTAKQVHPLVAKMREIDPAYAEYLEGLESRSGKVESLAQELQQIKFQNVLNKYESSVNSLHEQHKTPETVRGFIKEVLDAKARSGELELDQIGSAYKAIADRYNQLLDSTKRETTKSYVKDKSKDSSAPASQPKGVAAGAKKSPRITDSEDMKADVVKSALAKWKAERDI
jgi:hypothetical protein